jgi:hypothetical protein
MGISLSSMFVIFFGLPPIAGVLDGFLATSYTRA